MTAPSPGICSPCRIVRVIDGDTVEVEIMRRVTIRLIDCWAPETRTRDAEEKSRGLAAKEHLQQLLAQDERPLVFIPAADSGSIAEAFTLARCLGRLWLHDEDRRDVSARMVEAGHATAEKGI